MKLLLSLLPLRLIVVEVVVVEVVLVLVLVRERDIEKENVPPPPPLPPVDCLHHQITPDTGTTISQALSTSQGESVGQSKLVLLGYDTRGQR